MLSETSYMLEEFLQFYCFHVFHQANIMFVVFNEYIKYTILTKKLINYHINIDYITNNLRITMA